MNRSGVRIHWQRLFTAAIHWRDLAKSGVLVLIVATAGCSNSKSDASSEMLQPGLFVFDGCEYTIGRAEIVGALSDPYWCDTYNKGLGKSLGWSILFEAVAQEIDGELRSPHVDIDGLVFLKMPDWHDLVGLSVAWSEPVDDKTGERYGMTYFYDHQLITAGKLQVISREGTAFRVIASDKNEGGQTFSIDAPAKFVGIHAHGSGKDDDESIKKRLSAHISLVNLRVGPLTFRHRYENGVQMCSVLCTPVK